MKLEEHAYSGNCLEAIGIPNRGIAIIDRDMKPEVFDVVWCDDTLGSMGGFIKEIVRTGKNPVVRTRYKDPTLNFQFFPPAIFGVVLKVMDVDRNVVWERPAFPMRSVPIRAEPGEWVYALWEVPTKERFVVYTAEVKEVRLSKKALPSNATYMLEPIEFRGRLREYRDDDFGVFIFRTPEDAQAAINKRKETSK